jgi:RNA polymerase sigma-70 factor (ECF subfamily)
LSAAEGWVSFEKKVETEMVQTILSRLPEKYQTVLILYYMQDHSYRDIAHILSLPMGTVMSRLSRAKQAMKKALLRQRLVASASRTAQPLPSRR